MEEGLRHLANCDSNSKLDRLITIVISMRGNDALASDSALSSFGLLRSPLKTGDFAAHLTVMIFNRPTER